MFISFCSCPEYALPHNAMISLKSADDVNVEGAVATDEEGDRVFRQQMRQTIKARAFDRT